MSYYERKEWHCELRQKFTSRPWGTERCLCPGCQKMRIQDGIIEERERERESERLQQQWQVIEVIKQEIEVRRREQIEVMVRERERSQREWEKKYRELQER